MLTASARRSGGDFSRTKVNQHLLGLIPYYASRKNLSLAGTSWLDAALEELRAYSEVVKRGFAQSGLLDFIAGCMLFRSLSFP